MMACERTPARFRTLAWGGLLVVVGACNGLCDGLTGPRLHAAEAWPQFMFDARHSGNATDRDLEPGRLDLAATATLGDAILTSPVVADGCVFVVDGSGTCVCLDAATLERRWSHTARGGPQNVNNVASPVIAGPYLHVASVSGWHTVLERATGAVVREIDLHEPVMSTPLVGGDRVYVVTLGSRVHALEFAGTPVWAWDFVREIVGFDGDRWSGAAWLAARGERVTWRDHFVCSRDASLLDRTLVIPAGGRTVFLDDAGAAPRLRAVGEIPGFHGSEFPATFGQSIDAEGNVYVQWHRRDNAGRTEILRLAGDTVQTPGFVPGTETNIRMDGLLSFAPVAIRDGTVYRTRPQQGIGLCRHAPDATAPEVLSPRPSIAPPVLTRRHALLGGLDGTLEIVPLDGGPATLLAAGGPITAPVAVADGRVYVPCEDGLLYLFAAGDAAAPRAAAVPAPDLTTIRSPLVGEKAGSEWDWYTNYGNFAGQNANDQGLGPPLRMRWARRLEGTVKHLPVCGGGRLYTHTAEGQIIAVEQDTGRLLWRRHFPDVFLSFTSPAYVDGLLLVPQAGLKRSLVRCLDAATGALKWEAPFTGSPSWSRQFPPVVHGRVAIYASGSGDYAAQGSEKFFTFGGEPVPAADGGEVMSFIYSNDNPYYPRNHRPRIWAWDLDTGKILWERDFSALGRGGNDCGLCVLDGKLYYSVFFGYDAAARARRGLPTGPNGLTACLDPDTGETLWQTTDYYVTSKCTLSGRDGRLYIGGFNRARAGTDDRHVWCLDARDGSLVWQSEAVTSALNVVSVGERFVFSNALRGKGNVFDRDTGTVAHSILTNYACCRFTLSEPYVLGANMDVIDLSADGKLVSTGPAIDSRECLGAVVSNGRIFYTSQASGIVVSQTFGPESAALPPAWEARPEP
jgi:outer membrane protein assembly factor BamB